MDLQQASTVHLVFIGDRAQPVVRKVDHDPIRPLVKPLQSILPPVLCASGGEEVSKGRGEAIEGDLEQVSLLVRHIS